MNNLDLTAAINAANLGNTVKTATELQSVIDELRDIYRASSLKKFQYEVANENKEDLLENRMESIIDIQSKMDKNTLFINALDPVDNAEDIADLEHENAKLQLQIKDKQEAMETTSASRLKTIYDSIKAEVLKVQEAEVLEVLKEAFSFGDNQGWSVNDYGLKTV
ncbi:hypothetical protein EI427_05550 [Flammeovirga pectinis]|uniref:Uncharacterized protein n=1 Tax=Flammeovirga pectinis TaxID=2494373 RepID=A0A3S9P0M4_9BACT|nr:hypothetical protein [Flammeovirga pectinis]AZQ61716.1 hypothetical protein EI427_05550 [Flammeovirga pectinis]